MNRQLHQTTLNLISLIHFYQQVSDNNEKIRCAIKCAQLLTMEGAGTSGAKEKLQFCSKAVEAIASVVVESKFSPIKKGLIASILERDEIDFIQEMMISESRQEGEYEDNELNNPMKLCSSQITTRASTRKDLENGILL